VLLGGCSTLYPPPPGTILEAADPEFGREYTLYEPTTYSADRDWPLVVLCVGGAWPRASVLISDWGPLAEQHGLLLLAVQVSGGGRKADTEILQQDEKSIEAVLNHVRGRCRVRDDQVLIAGYGGAARSAAWTGLRHPETFRAVALLQPHFEAEELDLTQRFLDAHQPSIVVVKYGDLDKDQSMEVASWLQNRQVHCSEVRSSGARHTFPEVVLQFWERMLRQQPWVRVEAFKARPRTMRYRVQSSFKDVRRYEWSFGDGTGDVVAEPEHTYAQPGTYEVTVIVHPDGAHAAQTRRLQVTVTD
jgi:chitodextrinase